MEGDGQPQKESNVFMEKKGTDQSTETNELTLPEKLCQFYVERPKLAFGMFVFDCSLIPTEKQANNITYLSSICISIFIRYRRQNYLALRQISVC